MRNIHIIVAATPTGGIGFEGKLPWSIKSDLKRFQQITKGHACIMGRKTYEEIASIRGEFEDDVLPGRKCYVISSNKQYQPKGATRVDGLRDGYYHNDDSEWKLFVIGGEKLFIEALSWAERVHLTVVNRNVQCDRFFPLSYLDKQFVVSSMEHDPENEDVYFVTYDRKN